MKNIVICCDGTGNQLEETYSNVVKIYTCLVKNHQEQMVYYDPGVGTMGDPNVVTPWSKFISKLGGMAFGLGLKRNVSEAYTYLMEYYQPGDQIFLYGFSRGAYTVRVVAAMIHTIGLLDKGCQHLFPYAWETFRKAYKPKVRPVAEQFKNLYGRDVDIHFIGVWDTVTSFGLFNRIKLPYTKTNPSLRNIRHAIAIDERRTYYRQNLFTHVDGQNIKQVWFAGAHSDVGGSYKLTESGLSQLALEWMMVESRTFGVKIDEDKTCQLLYATKGHSVPNIKEAVHKSLSIFWWPLELMPKWQSPWPQVYLPMGRRRRLHTDYNRKPITPTIHQSVLDKLSLSPASYVASNFYPYKDHLIEPRVQFKRSTEDQPAQLI